jgi:hypothetical protein
MFLVPALIICFLEDNSIENVNFSNILKENAKLEDLMKEKSGHIKLEFNLIFQQFEETKKQTLKNSQQSGNANNVKVDNLFS